MTKQPIRYTPPSKAEQLAAIDEDLRVQRSRLRWWEEAADPIKKQEKIAVHQAIISKANAEIAKIEVEAIDADAMQQNIKDRIKRLNKQRALVENAAKLERMRKLVEELEKLQGVDEFDADLK